MTASYSGDPTASALDEVRYLLQDTTTATPLFTDAEITYLLTSSRSPLYAAAAGAEALAARFASTPGSRTLGDVTVSYADMASRYTTLAATLRRSAQFSPSAVPTPWAVSTSAVMLPSAAWANPPDEDPAVFIRP
jgi:hypothetical protein